MGVDFAIPAEIQGITRRAPCGSPARLDPRHLEAPPRKPLSAAPSLNLTVTGILKTLLPLTELQQHFDGVPTQTRPLAPTHCPQ